MKMVSANFVENEQYFRICETARELPSSYRNYNVIHVKELLETYRKAIILENVEVFTEIMQIYTDLKDFSKASMWMEKKEDLELKVLDMVESAPVSYNYFP